MSHLMWKATYVYELTCTYMYPRSMDRCQLCCTQALDSGHTVVWLKLKVFGYTTNALSIVRWK